MALTYLETSALMNDGDFKSRTKVACMKFASYIEGEASNVPAHNTRMRWATQTMASPDTSASQIMPMLVMDPQVQEQGKDIDDATLQTAVETCVNSLI